MITGNLCGSSPGASCCGAIAAVHGVRIRLGSFVGTNRLGREDAIQPWTHIDDSRERKLPRLVSMHCYYCGTKKVPEWTGRYRMDTGEQEFREVCGHEPCKHEGHDTPFDAPLVWRWWPPGFCQRCRRCGGLVFYDCY